MSTVNVKNLKVTEFANSTYKYAPEWELLTSVTIGVDNTAQTHTLIFDPRWENTYTDIKIVGMGLTKTTDNTNSHCRFGSYDSTDSGSNYDTTMRVAWSGQTIANNTSFGANGSTNAFIGDYFSGSNSFSNIDFDLIIFNYSVVSKFNQASYATVHWDAGEGCAHRCGSILWSNTTNSVGRFDMHAYTGTIDGGMFAIYGRRV